MLTVLSVGVSGLRNAYISKMFLGVSSRASPEPIRREGLLPAGQVDPLAGLQCSLSIGKQWEREARPLEEEGPRGMSSSLHPVLALGAIFCLLLACFLVLPDVLAFEIIAKTNLLTYTAAFSSILSWWQHRSLRSTATSQNPTGDDFHFLLWLVDSWFFH